MSDGLAGNLDCPTIRTVRAGDNPDERRFARPIFAEQRVNFAASQIKRHAFQRTDCAERFRDSVELKQRCAHALTNA